MSDSYFILNLPQFLSKGCGFKPGQYSNCVIFAKNPKTAIKTILKD